MDFFVVALVHFRLCSTHNPPLWTHSFACHPTGINEWKRKSKIQLNVFDPIWWAFECRPMFVFGCSKIFDDWIRICCCCCFLFCVSSVCRISTAKGERIYCDVKIDLVETERERKRESSWLSDWRLSVPACTRRTTVVWMVAMEGSRPTIVYFKSKSNPLDGCIHIVLYVCCLMLCCVVPSIWAWTCCRCALIFLAGDAARK